MSKSMPVQSPSSGQELRQQIEATVREAQAAAEAAAVKGAQAREQTRITIGAPSPPMAPMPGITIQRGNNDIPPQVAPISIAFFIMVAAIVIGLPIMRAIARRIERGTPVAPPISQEVRQQLQQISQSVDAIAIEVERISEGQRFTTKMLSDRPREGTVISPANPNT